MTDVLVVTTSYPTAEAPVAGVFVRGHALAAAAHCSVFVLHLERTPGLRGIRVEQGDDPDLPLLRVRFPFSPRSISYVGLLVAAAVGFRAVRRRGFEPDVLHAQFLTAALPAVLYGRRRRLPVVVTENWSVFLPDDPMTLQPLLQRAARYAFEHADLVLPVSRALEAGIAAHGIQARTRIIPNVVDTELFGPPAPRPPHDPPRLLNVSLFYPAKGVDLLVEAAALVQASGRRFQLDLVGDGEPRAELEAAAARLGVAGSLTFHGVRSRPEIAALMREADLYVLPSRFDSNPVALLEALVSGLPAVGTRVGGVPELIEADLLAEPTPASIAERIGAALDRLASFDRQAIATAAVARFGSESVGRQLAEVYETVRRSS